jgi:hypothetical protein
VAVVAAKAFIHRHMLPHCRRDCRSQNSSWSRDIKKLTPVKPGKDGQGCDAILGQRGMMSLGMSFDEASGDLVCTLFGPDRIGLLYCSAG